MNQLIRYLTVLLGTCIFLLAFSTPITKACIPPDSVVHVIVKYDTLNTVPCPTIKEVEVRLSNLRLMNEAPNKVCNCALTGISNVFTNLQYIAFVDSGTNNPYQGFQAWNDNAMASTAWNNAHSNPNGWSGYVANVTNSGLSANDPVEMIIRATAPPNVTLYADSSCTTDALDNMIRTAQLGTDEWDPINNELKASHQGIRTLNGDLNGGTHIYTLVTHAYFTQLDDDILNNIPTGSIESIGQNERLVVFPNPVDDQFDITYSLDKTSNVIIELHDLLGKKIITIYEGNLDKGQHVAGVDRRLLNVKSGVYVVSIKTDYETISKRIVLNK